MNPIDHEFTRNGFHHQLVERGGLVCIFRRWKDERTPHFEVVVLNEQPDAERVLPDGNKLDYPAHETYPSDEQWGRSAWTFMTRGEARDKFSELLAKQEARKEAQ